MLAVALTGFAFNLVFFLANDNRDFNQYYAAGKLVGTGHLYDWDAIRTLELQYNENVIPFGRIPAFAVAIKPFTWVSYKLARALWLGAGIAALAAFVMLWPVSSRARACAAVCWSLPAALCLSLGQDSILFLFFATCGLKLLLRGKEFWAGAAFSLCAGKPHLALLVPVFLAGKNKWKALLGAVVGGLIITSVSFAAEGLAWPAQLLSLMQLPQFDPAPFRMPNLRGLLEPLGGGLLLEVTVAGLVMVVVWFISRRAALPVGASLALAGGLQIGHHSYAYDGVLLLPALLLVFETPHPAWMRLWAMVLFSPIPYLLLAIRHSEWPGHLLISGFVLVWIVFLACTSRRRGHYCAPAT